MESITHEDRRVNEARLIAANQLLAQRRAEHKPAPPRSTSGWFTALAERVEKGGVQKTTVDISCPPSFSPHSSTIKLYPSLAAGWLKRGVAAEARLWLLCRHLDVMGQGCLTVEALREAVTDKTAALYTCGKRQLRKLLQRGEGVFWTRDEQGRLWLKGAAFVAHALDIEKLYGQPVLVPVTALCNIQMARAHFYASFFSGRHTDNPISRLTLEEVTGVNIRTQPIYEKLLNIQKEQCFAIGGYYSEDDLRDTLYRRVGNGFKFTDRTGKFGRENQSYVAWHLPNRYTGCHTVACRGRQRKINRHLNLVKFRAQGNEMEEGSLQRLFFDSGKALARQKLSNGTIEERYWQDSSYRRAWIAQ